MQGLKEHVSKQSLIIGSDSQPLATYSGSWFLLELCCWCTPGRQKTFCCWSSPWPPLISRRRRCLCSQRSRRQMSSLLRRRNSSDRRRTSFRCWGERRRVVHVEMRSVCCLIKQARLWLGFSILDLAVYRVSLTLKIYINYKTTALEYKSRIFILMIALNSLFDKIQTNFWIGLKFFGLSLSWK